MGITMDSDVALGTWVFLNGFDILISYSPLVTTYLYKNIYWWRCPDGDVQLLDQRYSLDHVQSHADQNKLLGAM